MTSRKEDDEAIKGLRMVSIPLLNLQWRQGKGASSLVPGYAGMRQGKLPTARVHDMHSVVPRSAPSLRFALTIVHGCGRVAKNGEGLVSFIT